MTPGRSRSIISGLEETEVEGKKTLIIPRKKVVDCRKSGGYEKVGEDLERFLKSLRNSGYDVITIIRPKGWKIWSLPSYLARLPWWINMTVLHVEAKR